MQTFSFLCLLIVYLLEKSNAIFLEKSFLILVIQQCKISGGFGSINASDGCVMKQQQHTEPETPNLYTSPPTIIMKEKIKLRKMIFLSRKLDKNLLLLYVS